MAAIKSYKDLDAWRIAMDLTVQAYELAKQLPQTERFELAFSMASPAVSGRNS